MDDVLFCTLTNNGYSNYTLNCLASLKRIGLKDKLHVYCCDQESYNTIKKDHENTHLFNQDILTDEENKNMAIFGSDTFGEVMKLKLMVVHHCLKKSKYVLFTDGDIVYFKEGFIEYLVDNIGDNNILIQNDKTEGAVSMGDKKPVCCAGFMFIKQNDETLKIYDMNTEDPLYRNYLDTSKRSGHFDDQIYLRRIRNSHQERVKMKLLPSALFPTYFVYRHRVKLNPPDQKYLLHYNYLTSSDKKKTMVGRGNWYI